MQERRAINYTLREWGIDGGPALIYKEGCIGACARGGWKPAKLARME